jgi:hypothetical protein
MSSASSVTSNSSNISNVSKKTFDRDDIEKLNYYLDENLMANDSTSRYSRASTNKSSRSTTVSNANSVASNRTVASIHEKPWKPA